MSPQMSGLVSSIACSLLVAIISTLVSIKVSAAQVWSAVAPSDRLPLVLASDPNPANRPMEVGVPRSSVGHGLPDGCEALASPLVQSAVAVACPNEGPRSPRAGTGCAHELPSRHFCEFEADQNGALHLVLFLR